MKKPAKGAGSSSHILKKTSDGRWRESRCEERLVHFADLFGFGNERLISRFHVIGCELHGLIGSLQSGELLEVCLVRLKGRLCIISLRGHDGSELFLNGEQDRSLNSLGGSSEAHPQ